MAKTLLDATNDILLRTGIIAGDAGALTTLADSARQANIDIALQVVNEGIEELYSTGGRALPKEQAEGTITLAATRSYSLASDLVALRWPFVDKTNTQYLYEADYNTLLLLDPEQDDTGLPYYAAINPTDGTLFLDRQPSATEIGNVYTYQYDKDLSLSAAADTMPFGDAVYRAMVPAWVQLWKRERRNEFDGDLFRAGIGRAARMMTQQQPRSHYSPRC